MPKRSRRFARRCHASPGIRAEERALPVHHLVVGEREHEVLGLRVHGPEGELVVVVLPHDRVPPQVLERVVHPAHVPFVAEAEPALVGRPRDERPGRRLLRDRLRAFAAPVDLDVQPPQELDRVEVLAAAEAVRHPLALLARVVEVEHRGHGVDAQRVGVVELEPVHGAAQEEAPHLVAPVVEDEAAPVGVEALARVAVLVEVGAVEVAEAVGVGRESGRAPSRGSRRARAGAAGRSGTSGPGARRSGSSARSSRWSGSPRSRRTGAPSRAGARRG